MARLPAPIGWEDNIGKFVVAFNAIESLTDLALKYLYSKPVWELITSKWLSERLKFMEAGFATENFTNEFREDVKLLVKELLMMAEKRNTVAHGNVFWHIEQDHGRVRHVWNTQKGKDKNGFELGELKQMVKDVRDLTKRLEKLGEAALVAKYPEAVRFVPRLHTASGPF
jgi:hypothetical protein